MRVGAATEDGAALGRPAERRDRAHGDRGGHVAQLLGEADAHRPLGHRLEADGRAVGAQLDPVERPVPHRAAPEGGERPLHGEAQVLEKLYPDEFERVLGWLVAGELATQLADLEGSAKPKKGAGAEASPRLRDWAQLPPALADIDLEPCLRLAASLHRVAAGATRLAVVRAIRDAESPGEAARAFQALLPGS